LTASNGTVAIDGGSDLGMAREGAPTAAPAPSYVNWYTVWMTSLVAVMSQVDRGILALFVQPMKRDLHLTDTQISILLGFAFTFFYVVGGPPLSRMADGGVRKSVIAGCLAVWSLATTFCGIAQNFWSFFIARAVIGGTESGCGPASLSMIADAVPKDKLPRAYALYNSGFVGGSALSLVIGGVLIGLLADVKPISLGSFGVIYNWQIVFMIIGLPGLLIAALVMLTVKEPPRKGGRRPGGYPLKEVVGFVVSQRRLHLPLLVGLLAMNFQLYGLAAWMPAFYERTYGWGPAVSGPLLGMVGLVSAMAGLFLGSRSGWASAMIMPICAPCASRRRWASRSASSRHARPIRGWRWPAARSAGWSRRWAGRPIMRCSTSRRPMRCEARSMPCTSSS